MAQHESWKASYLKAKGIDPHKAHSKDNAGDCIMAYFESNNGIGKVQSQLAPLFDDKGIIAVDPDDYHITLLYTHNTMDETFINQLPLEQFAFTVTVNGVDTFDTPDGYAIHLTVTQDNELRQLQNTIGQLAGRQDGLEISPYSRVDSYTPHITVGYSDSNIDPFPIEPTTLLVNRIMVTQGESNNIIREHHLKAYRSTNHGTT